MPSSRPILGSFRSCSSPAPAIRSCITRQQRKITAWTAATKANQAARPSFLWRAASFTGSALLFAGLGFAMAAGPALSTVDFLRSPPSDADTLLMWEPADDEAREKQDYLDAHPLVVSLRADPNFVESRPHLKVPPAWRAHSLTAGALLGPGRVALPPLGFTEKDGGPRYVQILHAGPDLCGHPGVIHGGFLATTLDEGLWRCCSDEQGRNLRMTAKLDIDYKVPTIADQFLVLRGTRTKVEGRKAWVEGHIETLPRKEGEDPVVLVKATALYVTPKNASWVAKTFTSSTAKISTQTSSEK